MYMNVVELSEDGSCFSSSVLLNKMDRENLGGGVLAALNLLDNTLFINKYFSCYSFDLVY